MFHDFIFFFLMAKLLRGQLCSKNVCGKDTTMKVTKTLSDTLWIHYRICIEKIRQRKIRWQTNNEQTCLGANIRLRREVICYSLLGLMYSCTVRCASTALTGSQGQKHQRSFTLGPNMGPWSPSPLEMCTCFSACELFECGERDI